MCDLKQPEKSKTIGLKDACMHQPQNITNSFEKTLSTVKW